MPDPNFALLQEAAYMLDAVRSIDGVKFAGCRCDGRRESGRQNGALCREMNGAR